MKPPPATPVTISRESTVSVTCEVVGLETPVFFTSIVNVWPVVPASTPPSANCFVASRLTSSTIATVVGARRSAFSSDETCAVFATDGSASVVVSTW